MIQNKQRFLDEFGYKSPIPLSTRLRGFKKMADKNKFEVPDGFSAVEATQVKFEKVGDSVKGELLSKETGGNYGNPVYIIRDDEGKSRTVFSTVVLQTKMTDVNVGDEVYIVFTGTIPTKKKGQQDTKDFTVAVKRK